MTETSGEATNILSFGDNQSKRCRICEKLLPIEQFYLAKSNKDGRHNSCRTCFQAAAHVRYLANPSPIKERSRLWHKNNPEKARAAHADQYRKTKVAHAKKTKEYRESHLARLQEVDKAWRAANRDRLRVQNQLWRAENAERLKQVKREGHLRRNYGISVERYMEIFEEQFGRCGICGGSEAGGPKGASFGVDHNHDTGKIRGLLCMSCNTALGHFKESKQLLRTAIRYLEKHEKN